MPDAYSASDTQGPGNLRSGVYETDKLLRGVALHRAGRTRQASRLYDGILKRDPDNVMARQLRAQIHYRSGQLEAAIVHLEQALRFAAGRASLWSDLGKACGKLERKEDALDAYERSLQIEPANARVLNNCATILKELGRLDEAIDKYDRALNLAPGNVDILINLGNAYKEAGRLDQAAFTYRRAVAVRPDNRKARLSLGLTLLDQKQISEAHSCLREVLSMDPNETDALRGLSAILDLVGKQEEAIAAAGRTAQFKMPTIQPCTGMARGCILVLKCVENRSFRMNEKWQLGSPADNNMKEYIDLNVFDVVELYVEHFAKDRSVLDRIPSPSVVLNTIAEADDKSRSLSLAADIIGRLGRPAINLPPAIRAATRDLNFSILSGIPGLVFPRTSRIKSFGRTACDIWSELESKGHTFPVIIRLPGSHLGTTMELIHDFRELAAFISANVADELYVIRFYNSPRPHGFYRRFRMFFLDGKPYPANCYFGTGWNVHREESDKLTATHRCLRELELSFLHDPAQCIGVENYRLLQSFPEVIKLDYFGVDFNVTSDGSLLIYEANAAMAHRRDREIESPYLTPFFDAFAHGFQTMLLDRITSA